MSSEEVINRIRSRGYWRVEIRPTMFEKLRIPTFSEARELVQSCKVQWGGWDYPHWNEASAQNMSDWVESQEDWEHHIEHWRFYRSGQFVHLFALHEDHLDLREVLPTRYPARRPRAGYVSYVWATHKVTEILEFASRLANKHALRPSAFISIGLYNLKDHELTSFSASRHLDDGYVYSMEDPIVIEREIPQDELVVNAGSFALDFIVEIFERFNWNNPPRQILAEEQKRLRERRL